MEKTGFGVDGYCELCESAGMRHAVRHLHLHDHSTFHICGKPHLIAKE